MSQAGVSQARARPSRGQGGGDASRIADGPVSMKRFLLALLLLIVVIGIGGATYLAFYPIPAPTKHMEVAVPNDKLSN